MAPFIFNRSTRFMWMVSLTPRPLYPHDKVGGLDNLRRDKCLALAGLEPGSFSCSQVSVVTADRCVYQTAVLLRTQQDRRYHSEEYKWGTKYCRRNGSEDDTSCAAWTGLGKRQLRATCAYILKGNKDHVDDDQTLVVLRVSALSKTDTVVTVRRVRVTSFAMEKQYVLHILSVCL